MLNSSAWRYHRLLRQGECCRDHEGADYEKLHRGEDCLLSSRWVMEVVRDRVSTGYLRVNGIYTVVVGMASQIVADASGANFMALWDCCSH